MSDVSQGPGWWEASDGKWYPPESPPGTADPVDDTAAADAGAGVVHRVLGTVMPVLEIDLQPGQTVIAQGGELSWITSSIALSTSTKGGGGSKGLMSAVKRVVGGGTLFMTEFRAERTPGTVAFATKLPGEIRPVEVRPDRTYMVHRHGFLAGTADVELAIAFQQSFGAGLFGGTGFILQRVSGNGTAWIELSGELVEYHLAAGETLRVHPGHVGLLDESVDFSIVPVKGIKNMVFGADSIFLAALTGPGTVWLQSLPLPNLAHALKPYLEGRDQNQTNKSAGFLSMLES
jgi:uncharacterized protein (TIGR00266 family)